MPGDHARQRRILSSRVQEGEPIANYHHMLKRKGQLEYEPAGHVNIPPWKQGDERRVTVGDGQLCVRVIERMNKERVIYTEEIDLLCLFDRADENA